MASSKDISMRQLRYFVAAATTGRFSQAALDVHVSQSAITSAVAQLEENLGVNLFERQPYGVALTAEGHRFLQHARHILDTLNDALKEPLFLSHTQEGVVRVGATYAVLGYFLPSLLARFKRSYPQVDIDLVDMDRPSIEQAVLEGRLDLGLIIVSNSEAIDRFEHYVLIRSRRQLWLASHHPLMTKPDITLKDVAEHAYILGTVEEGEASTQRYWQARGLEPRVAFRTSSMESVRGLVAHGFGVTILSDMVFRTWSLEGKKIEVRPLNDAVPPMELGLIWKPDTELPTAAEAFRQFLIQACGM
ncbi:MULTISPECIES: LysR substrate-binding domain-containing protein [Pseudomonas]|uniref:LysR family transcriptional regulator n=1 Tax=Pseudomonas luteola TaxID=47886 RepID=A0ABS0MLW8_PSELU|nr:MULTISPECIES: LysR substrate-binding domain-containing protein [Pseudomonas]MBH3437480.1 LysR family transcriptional regulator [Pseudomonas luteola]MDN3236743.1 LysR substrate-binding domain-containing protein [Pseudomonas sp. WAC2]RRW44743.1 LysR family transcriptional regulator [Pseudomonas luteola]